MIEAMWFPKREDGVGLAEQWFETRGDTVSMVRHFQRIAAEENVIDVKG